ncbi:MAG TPA: FHA domain-containing protein [bacterium]
MDELKRTMFDPPEPKEPEDYKFKLKQNRPHLLVLSGVSKGREITIKKDPFIIGRDANADLCIKEELVSRRHTSIYFKNTVFRIKDLASTNGTYLNGKKISDSILNNSDKIQIGDTVVQFLLGTIEL